MINRLHLKIYNELERLKQSFIMEVGCGEGYLINYITKKNPKLKIIGLDINKTVLEYAKILNPTVHFLNKSILSLPFENNTIPLIICSEVLEHIKKPSKAISELLRVSSIGIILTVPNEPLFVLSNMASLNYLKNLGNPLGHINHWHTKSFVNYFMKNWGSKAKIISIQRPYPWILMTCIKREKF